MNDEKNYNASEQTVGSWNESFGRLIVHTRFFFLSSFIFVVAITIFMRAIHYKFLEVAYIAYFTDVKIRLIIICVYVIRSILCHHVISPSVVVTYIIVIIIYALITHLCLFVQYYYRPGDGRWQYYNVLRI